MRRMKPVSARTLTWLAAALAMTGCVILSPSGSILLLAAASLSALFPALFGRGLVRFIAAVLLLASLGLALGRYPAFKHEQEMYREGIDTRSQERHRTE